jgi:hypothetical protein
MASQMTIDPKSHIFLVGDQKIEGWKSFQITLPNEQVTIENNADGSATFIEHVQPNQFEVTVTIGSAHSGNNILLAARASGSFVPVTFTNLRGLKVLICRKARMILNSFGQDAGGGDTPTEWKIIGIADAISAGGSLDLDLDLDSLFPPIPKI